MGIGLASKVFAVRPIQGVLEYPIDPKPQLQRQFAYVSWLVAYLPDIIPDTQIRELKKVKVRLEF